MWIHGIIFLSRNIDENFEKLQSLVLIGNTVKSVKWKSQGTQMNKAIIPPSNISKCRYLEVASALR